MPLALSDASVPSRYVPLQVSSGVQSEVSGIELCGSERTGPDCYDAVALLKHRGNRYVPTKVFGGAQPTSVGQTDWLTGRADRTGQDRQTGILGARGLQRLEMHLHGPVQVDNLRLSVSLSLSMSKYVVQAGPKSINISAPAADVQRKCHY